MSKKILFTDLDDTLFQSRRKCSSSDDLLPVAYLQDGTAHSFQTKKQANLLKAVMLQMIVVPVTARNTDAFKRVKIDFTHGAIINFGGTILNPDGEVNETWLARVSLPCKRFRPILDATAEWASRIADKFGGGLRARVIEDHGLPFYLSIKSSEGEETALDEMESALRERLRGANLSVNRNGNNLVALPTWLDKRHAVAFLTSQLATHYGPITTIGMGDSLSDLGFMEQCDLMIAPSGSQIARSMSFK